MLLEKGSAGSNLTFTMWKPQNQLSTGVTRCKANLLKRDYSESDKCDCGRTQDLNHLFNCPNMATTCKRGDTFLADDKVTYVAEYWNETI